MSDATKFIEGRDLACELIRVANEAMDKDSPNNDCWLDKKIRKGRPQANFVLTYIEKLRAEPELAEGFAAVLSDHLGTVNSCPLDDQQWYATLPLNRMR